MLAFIMATLMMVVLIIMTFAMVWLYRGDGDHGESKYEVQFVPLGKGGPRYMGMGPDAPLISEVFKKHPAFSKN